MLQIPVSHGWAMRAGVSEDTEHFMLRLLHPVPSRKGTLPLTPSPTSEFSSKQKTRLELWELVRRNCWDLWEFIACTTRSFPSEAPRCCSHNWMQIQYFSEWWYWGSWSIWFYSAFSPPTALSPLLIDTHACPLRISISTFKDFFFRP